MQEKRNMILTLAGMGVSGLGSSLYSFAISFYILAVTGSGSSFALSLILSTLPRVVLNPIVGNLVDRMNRKWLVVGADLMSGLLMFAVYFLTMKSELSLFLIYSASFLLSVCNVVLSTSFSASFASLVTDKYITKLNSLQQTIQAIIQIGAPILGGMVYALIDIRLFILVNGFSFILSGITEIFIDFTFNSKLIKTDGPINSFIENFVEGFKYVKSNKMYVSLAVYALIINFFLSGFSVIMPYTLVTIHGFAPEVLGLVEAAFPIGMLITSLIIGTINIQFSKQLLGRGIFCLAIILALFSIPSLPVIDLGSWTIIYYSVIFALLASVVIVINVPLGVKFQTSVDEAYRGRFFGFLGMMAEGIIPLSYLLCGFLIGIIPTYVILYVAAIALVIITMHIMKNKFLDESINEEKVIESVRVPG